MKQIFQTFALASITFFQATTFAGGKSALLKALVKNPKVSRLSLNSLKEMNAAINAVDEGKYFIWDTRRGVLEESNNGLTGRVHALTSNRDNSITNMVFQIPEASVKPLSTEISPWARGIYVKRKFKGVRKEVIYTEGYNVEQIRNVPMRVQNSGSVIEGNKAVFLTPEKDGLTVSLLKGSGDTWWNNTMSAKGKLPIDEKSGKLIGFNIDMNENRLTIQLAEGPDKITERTYEVAVETRYAGDLIKFKDVGLKKLSTQEIKDAGFLAYLKTLNEKAPARSMIATRGLEITR